MTSGIVQLWNVLTGTSIKQIGFGSSTLGKVGNVSFSPFEKTLVGFTSPEGRVRVWDVVNDTLSLELDQDLIGEIVSMNWSASSSLIGIAHHNGLVRVSDIRYKNATVCEFLPQKGGSIKLQWANTLTSGQSHSIATLGSAVGRFNKQLKIWDIRACSVPVTELEFSLPESGFNILEFDSNSGVLMASCRKSRVFRFLEESPTTLEFSMRGESLVDEPHQACCLLKTSTELPSVLRLRVDGLVDIVQIQRRITYSKASVPLLDSSFSERPSRATMHQIASEEKLSIHQKSSAGATERDRLCELLQNEIKTTSSTELKNLLTDVSMFLNSKVPEEDNSTVLILKKKLDESRVTIQKLEQVSKSRAKLSFYLVSERDDSKRSSSSHQGKSQDGFQR